MWNRPEELSLGSAVIIFIIVSTGSPTSQLFTPQFVHTEVAGCREPRPVETSPTRALQTSSVLPGPGSAPGEGRPWGPDPGDYISHNSVPRRHLGGWAVAAWGLALQAARMAQLTPNLGLHHGGRGTPTSRASGDLGSACPPSPLLHPRASGPRVRPREEACSLPAGQGPEDPEVGGSHVSSSDLCPVYSAHSPPFSDVPCFCFSEVRTLGSPQERKSGYRTLRTPGLGAGRLKGIADS